VNLSLAQKQTLQALVEAGAQCATIAYNPTTVTGTPEADAVTAGWVQWYREASANLVEVIYTK
jgi:hypothetical protein